jgi:hypothetical protein
MLIFCAVLALVVVLAYDANQSRLARPRLRARELAGSVGEFVSFSHPTRRRELISGWLVAVNDSELSAAWLAVTMRDADSGAETVYQVDARARVFVGTH